MENIKSPEWRTQEEVELKRHTPRRLSEELEVEELLLPPPAPKPEQKDEEEDGQGNGQDNSRSLLISFLLMVLIGLGNKVFQKLQTIPMYNYPIFLNLLTTCVYIPISFAYILPMIRWGSQITAEQRAVPKRTFAVMGTLDAMSGCGLFCLLIRVFAATYLPGALLILLSQSAIPVSMLISKMLLNVKYSVTQYVGASVVAVGLLIVLSPSLHGGGEGEAVILWATVMILSCVPMCLSSVYKEIALAETEMDPMYLNGWIAIFQLLLSLPLMIPSGLVLPGQLWNHLRQGMLCYLGQDSVHSGRHPDNCALAPVYVNVYLAFNVFYNLLIILILKYSSANVLFLAMTVMVPMGNVVFTLPFVPDHQPLHWTDVAGLAVILAGLVCYRFLDDWRERRKRARERRRATSKEFKKLARQLSPEDGEDSGDEVYMKM